MYNNGVEPHVGETIFKTKSEIHTNYAYNVLINGLIADNEIVSDEVIYGKYGGKIDDDTWHTTEGKYARLWVNDCYVKRNLQLN